MQLAQLLAFFFATLAVALPWALSDDTLVDTCTGDSSIAGYCTPLTYVDKTSSASGTTNPTQCQHTCSEVLTDAGDWNVDFSGDPTDPGYKHAVLGFDCGFSVSRGDGEPTSYSFNMANQDILDLVRESSSRFGADNKSFAAEGTMNCAGHEVKWYIE
ncbi:hypothetical protein F5Y15DRAFT_416069 [Xylariaceae sp. FL0016]|nr:hypothetical protein F5Y15DRAFT_416069 [Xylariaceae sp. FL0016]